MLDSVALDFSVSLSLSYLSFCIFGYGIGRSTLAGIRFCGFCNFPTYSSCDSAEPTHHSHLPGQTRARGMKYVFFVGKHGHMIGKHIWSFVGGATKAFDLLVGNGICLGGAILAIEVCIARREWFVPQTRSCHATSAEPPCPSGPNQGLAPTRVSLRKCQELL